MKVDAITLLQVCTSEVACFCNEGYTGKDCSERSNITLIRLTTIVPPILSPTLTTESVNITNSTLTIAPYVVTTLPRAVHWAGMLHLMFFTVSSLFEVRLFVTYCTV